MADGYPDDQARTTRAMQRQIDQAQGSAGRRPPLTEASAGWILRARSSPDEEQLGPGDVWIFARGGELWARNSGGGEVPLRVVPDFPQGVFVSNPPNFASGTASGSDAAVINQLRADAAGTKIALDHLLSSLRGAGLISSF